jgi:hypothetical protein
MRSFSWAHALPAAIAITAAAAAPWIHAVFIDAAPG